MQQSGTRLRSACDVCHQSKVKCSGGNPCRGCQRIGISCNYSSSNQNGRPRGVKNKKTIQRMQAAAAANAASNAAREDASRKTVQHTPPGTASEDKLSPLAQFGMNMIGDSEEIDIGIPGFPDDIPEDDFADIEFSKFLTDESLFSDKPFVFPTEITIPNGGLDMFDNQCGIKGDQSSTKLHCDCLPQLAAQLVRLKSFSRQSDRMPQTAGALPHIRDAVSTWQHHFQCRLCAKSGDHDAFVLMAIGIRTLLPVIEKLGHQLHFGGQFILSLHSPDPSLRFSPTSYGLAHDESQVIIHTLLLRNLDTIISILHNAKEHMLVEACQNNPISTPHLVAPQALPSPPFTGVCTDFQPSLIFPGQNLEQPLDGLIQCAEGLRKRLSSNQ